MQHATERVERPAKAKRRWRKKNAVCSHSAVMHRTYPSMVLMKDSVLSSDAATFSPSSLNQ